MKKKTRIIALLLVCVLIACTSASFVSAAELRYYNYGTVSVEAANFRARPELDENNVLGTLLKEIVSESSRELLAMELTGTMCV